MPATEIEVLIKNYFNKAHRPLSFQDKRPDFDFKKIIIELKFIKCNSSKIDMSIHIFSVNSYNDV
ncbi:hypothetical protein [Macrococcus armenti]|uniref:hypothetical protein n=1 Tax=Macrococcus armenti TaxID=2875764 RepID=UPI001CCE5434|nr:hypothetical protein [Macrococcus armenti]UBH18187.1 hypothetical protein LAU39_02440 [Macrococcus armenti]